MVRIIDARDGHCALHGYCHHAPLLVASVAWHCSLAALLSPLTHSVAICRPTVLLFTIYMYCWSAVLPPTQFTKPHTIIVRGYTLTIENSRDPPIVSPEGPRLAGLQWHTHYITTLLPRWDS